MMLTYFVEVPEGFKIERDNPSVCSVCFCIVPVWGQKGHEKFHAN